MSPAEGLPPRPETPVLAVAAMAVLWVGCLYGALICYFLFQLEYVGMFGARGAPVDPVWISVTVVGMLAGVVAPAVTSYLVLRRWRLIAVAAVLGVVVCAVTLQLLYLTVLGAS
ncbi:hypothetical protein RF644_08315 [Kocuria sp. CPCC 205258]|jgi:hypothetical protein|uniref:hypothetical protein n=1 Tax=Kocuria sp. CPCC 205258 TaxID=3073552 RepID=UPI0034D5B650